MDDTRSDRWMALAGPAFLVLIIVAVVLEGSTPGDGAAEQIAALHFREVHDKALASVFFAIPAGALLLVAASRLRAAFGERAGAAATLFQSGAVLYAGALAAGAAVTLGAVSAADNNFDDVVHTLSALSEAMWLPVVLGIAVMLFGGGLAVLHTAVLPRWLGWVGVVVGAISVLGPGGFLGFFVAPFWIAIAGVLLYTRDGAGTATT